jgi:helix-turn-helix protein
VTPQQAAHDTRAAIVLFTAGFMMDPATHTRGTELGFEGFDFYVAGRGGVLGDAPADVVVATFLFFAPDAVRAGWERSANVISRRQAAEEWAATAHDWARRNLAADTDWARVAELIGRVVQRADVAGAPLFAGWRTLPEPSAGDAKALAIHRLNALRELRGALHGAAVLTVGLTPFEAGSVLAPKMLSVQGWTEPARDAEALRDRWQLAEARTDRMLGRDFAVLDESERDELVEMLTKAAQ